MLSLDLRVRSSALSSCPPQEALAMMWVLSCLFKLDKPRVHCHSSQDMSQDVLSSLVTSFVVLLSAHWRTLTSFLIVGAKNCTECWGWGHTKSFNSGIIITLDVSIWTWQLSFPFQVAGRSRLILGVCGRWDEQLPFLLVITKAMQWWQAWQQMSML